MGITVYYNYYVPGDPVRAAELLSCFCVMVNDPQIQRLVVLSDAQPTMASDRLVWRHVSRRPTFAEYFSAMEALSSDDDVNVVINSDCCIDPATSGRLHQIGKDEAYCISRHDVMSLLPLRYRGTPPYFLRCFSADCWAIRGRPRRGLSLDFSLGMPGCDERLAYELKSAGYRLRDPYKAIRVFHLHPSTNERSYSAADRVPGPYASPTKYGMRAFLSYEWAMRRVRLGRVRDVLRMAIKRQPR
jgi:hypothetical protein